jgi:thiamine transport system permease protein
LDGASESHIRRRVELPQQLPGLFSASLLVALYSATSFGLVLTLGAGQVKTLETEIAIATLQQLDLERAGLYAALQTLLTVAMFLFSKRISGSTSPLDQIEKTILRPTLFEKALGLSLSALVFVAIGFVVSKSFDGPGLFTNLNNLSTKGERQLLNITVVDAGLNSIRGLPAKSTHELLGITSVDSSSICTSGGLPNTETCAFVHRPRCTGGECLGWSG